MSAQTTTITVETSADIPDEFTGITEWSDGSKRWWLNGELHREDGPAYEGSNGYKQWWLDGKYYFSNTELRERKSNYIILKRGILTEYTFGSVLLTRAEILTAKGIEWMFDNFPGLDVGEGNE
jgi:hypothetical protein